MDLTPAETTAAGAVAQRVLDRVRAAEPVITATYRLQLHREFTFHHAAAVVPYLHALGVSHVYCSPFLRARQGSAHGYDTCSHGEFNPELGGEAGFRAFVAALRAHNMGQILDIVPNHMAASLENPWWFDVLENGPVSPYSSYFDVDWEPVKRELADKVLLPVLGQQYGEALEDGQLQLEYREGAFFVRYYDHAFPLGPKTAKPLLTDHLEELRQELGEGHSAVAELESIATALEHLPKQSARDPAAIRERQREKEVIKKRLAALTAENARVSQHLERNLRDYNGDRAQPESFDRLDRLLDAQPYRLSYWRSAADEINYRRFFDINELAAICMELPEVFHATHALVRPFVADGTIAGLRIDHVDGLFDPEQYLWRLQWAYLNDLGAHCLHEYAAAAVPEATAEPAEAPGGEPIDWRRIAPVVLHKCVRALGMRALAPADLRAAVSPDPAWEPLAPAAGAETPRSTTPPARGPGGTAAPLCVLVEKILGPDEPLPEAWPVAGTSGYDFLGSLSGLFVVPQGCEEVLRIYERFLDRPSDLKEVEYHSKLLILRAAMASELQMLAHRLNLISEQHRRSRDFTLNNLRGAIREVLACFPVYRVYPGRDGISDRDRRFVNLAVARAIRRRPEFDPSVFEFLRSVLLLNHPPGLSPEQIAEREMFTGKFQQVTSPVMAKGVEDTAFYIHVPLVSVNEVGGDLRRPATSVADFHELNRQRNQRMPRAMLATSTHDTKRSEDVRARLHVLSEVPRAWRSAIHRFARNNKRHIREVDGEPAPSRNDEYLYYQSLLGIWPLEPPRVAERNALVERLTQYMEKATREAKLRTSWVNPNQEYDTAVREFVAQTLRDSPRNKFLQGLQSFFAEVAPAGQYNALAQVALKLLSPGIPDVYQGQELWDYSLVDPDNRRPVDYALREKLLEEVRAWETLPTAERTQRLMALGCAWSDPRLKLLVTYRLLQLRRARQTLFQAGQYLGLEVSGPLAQHVVALGWRRQTEEPLEVLALVPRQMHALLGQRDLAGSSWARIDWADTAVQLPERHAPALECVFSGRTFTASERALAVGPLLEAFPLAVLHAPAQSAHELQQPLPDPAA